MRNIRNWKASLFLIVVVFHTLVACNKNDSGSAPAAPVYNPGFYPSCPTCIGTMGGYAGIQGGAALLSGVKSSTGSERIMFALDLIATGPSAANPMDVKAAAMYNGPVALRGAMRVTDPYDATFCYAAPGDYDVQTVEMIQMSSLMLGGGRLIAQGRMGQGQIVMRIGNAQFYNSIDTVMSNSPNNRVGLNLFVDSVNGRPCGSVSTF